MLVCQGCGQNLKYNIAAKKLKCDYCDSLYDPYAFDDKDKDAEENELFDVTVYTCPQCGGELYSTDNASAAFCAYCGASTILYSRLAKEKKPAYIVPFSVTKEDCKEAYRKRTKAAFFLPNEYRDETFIDGFRGVYMPYWSYDVKQNTNLNLSGKKSHRQGDYIITDHYSLEGRLDASYSGISYDASSALYDSISESLAPFNVKERKPFTVGFMSGFYADTSDVGTGVYSKNALDFANAQTKSGIESVDEFRCNGLDSGSIKPEMLGSSISKTELALMPVWFMSFRNRDRVAYLAVNGQTGKVVADMPIDRKKFLLGSFIAFIPVFLMLNLIFTFTPRASMIISLIFEIIAFIIYKTGVRQINEKDNNIGDKGMEGVRGKADIDELRKQGKWKKTNPVVILGTLGAVALGIIVCILNPIYDYWYYGTSILASLVAGYGFVEIIKHYNELVTHKLPQFDKKGGDDGAK